MPQIDRNLQRDRDENLQCWRAPIRPSHLVLKGMYCKLEPCNVAKHGRDLFASFAEDKRDWVGWRHLAYGPFKHLNDFCDWLEIFQTRKDFCPFVIYDMDRKIYNGIASYLRISEEIGSIEVGHIHFGKTLRQTRSATEAMFLMMRWAFVAGYRRYEWKCNVLNRMSVRAAKRLGFSYEGTFRQASIVKNRNRDTAWFACIDKEWPSLHRAYNQWLKRDNFDEQGRARSRLSDCIKQSQSFEHV